MLNHSQLGALSRPAWHRDGGSSCNWCVVTVKQLSNLLECRATRLDVVEVDNETLGNEDSDVEEVELPSQLLDADGVDVLVEDTAKGGEAEAEAEAQREALGADLVRQDLDGVGDCEAGPGETGDAVEEEDHGEHGGASC